MTRRDLFWLSAVAILIELSALLVFAQVAKGPKRIVIPDDAEVFVCGSMAQPDGKPGRTCKSANDVLTYIRGDDRECHEDASH